MIDDLTRSVAKCSVLEEGISSVGLLCKENWSKMLHFGCLFIVAMSFLSIINGQPEVCMFENHHADCYYRIDPISLSHIRGEIDKCSDPVEVTITIDNKDPRVDFEFTFSRSDQTVSVPGFRTSVKLQVKLNMKEDDTLNLEIDIFVYGKPKTDFVNSDVKLGRFIDACPLLNKAAQIAIGIMGGLVVVIAILILVLLLIRYRRRQKAVASANRLMSNADVSLQRNSTEEDQAATGVKYSEIVKSHENQLKFSDC